MTNPIARALTQLGIFQIRDEDLLPWHVLARYWRQGE